MPDALLLLLFFFKYQLCSIYFQLFFDVFKQYLVRAVNIIKVLQLSAFVQFFEPLC